MMNIGIPPLPPELIPSLARKQQYAFKNFRKILNKNITIQEKII